MVEQEGGTGEPTETGEAQQKLLVGTRHANEAAVEQRIVRLGRCEPVLLDAETHAGVHAAITAAAVNIIDRQREDEGRRVSSEQVPPLRPVTLGQHRRQRAPLRAADVAKPRRHSRRVAARRRSRASSAPTPKARARTPSGPGARATHAGAMRRTPRPTTRRARARRSPPPGQSPASRRARPPAARKPHHPPSAAAPPLELAQINVACSSPSSRHSRRHHSSCAPAPPPSPSPSPPPSASTASASAGAAVSGRQAHGHATPKATAAAAAAPSDAENVATFVSPDAATRCSARPHSPSASTSISSARFGRSSGRCRAHTSSGDADAAPIVPHPPDASGSRAARAASRSRPPPNHQRTAAAPPSPSSSVSSSLQPP